MFLPATHAVHSFVGRLFSLGVILVGFHLGLETYGPELVRDPVQIIDITVRIDLTVNFDSQFAK